MRKEQFSLQLKMKTTSTLRYLLQQLFGQRLCAELSYQTFVINLASDFPWGNNHFVSLFISQARAILCCSAAYTIHGKHINFVWKEMEKASQRQIK
jgi:hypothetical protein